MDWNQQIFFIEDAREIYSKSEQGIYLLPQVPYSTVAIVMRKKINEEDVINKTWIGQDILIAVFSLIPGISWST